MSDIVAVASRRGEVYAYRGPDEGYPVRLRGLTCDGGWRVDSRVHKFTSRLNGARFHAAERGTDEGEFLAELVEELDGARDTETILSVLDDFEDMLDNGGPRWEP